MSDGIRENGGEMEQEFKVGDKVLLQGHVIEYVESRNRGVGVAIHIGRFELPIWVNAADLIQQAALASQPSMLALKCARCGNGPIVEQDVLCEICAPPLLIESLAAVQPKREEGLRVQVENLTRYTIMPNSDWEPDENGAWLLRSDVLTTLAASFANDDAYYAAYANHCAIQKKLAMTKATWKREGRPNAPAASPASGEGVPPTDEELEARCDG